MQHVSRNDLEGICLDGMQHVAQTFTGGDHRRLVVAAASWRRVVHGRPDAVTWALVRHEVQAVDDDDDDGGLEMNTRRARAVTIKSYACLVFIVSE